MIFGYARVSTKSQEDNTSLQNQIEQLKDFGCQYIYSEVASATNMNREEFNKLENELKEGDMLVVTKLDRFTRNTSLGIQKIKELSERGIKVNILNIGVVDVSNAMGNMIFTILCAFSEYEKDCILERMKEGKQIARQKENFREGRKKKFNKEQRNHALKLLETMSYKEVEKITKMSKSTLVRLKREHKSKI